MDRAGVRQESFEFAARNAPLVRTSNSVKPSDFEEIENGPIGRSQKAADGMNGEGARLNYNEVDTHVESPAARYEAEESTSA